nr:hypothetical protein [Mesorhizobium sp.]
MRTERQYLHSAFSLDLEKCGRTEFCSPSSPVQAVHATMPLSKVWADRADALFADPRASDPGRVLQEYPDLLSPDFPSPDLLSPDLLSLVGLAVIGGFGLLTMVREEVRLGTVCWNSLSRTRL